MLSPSLQTIVAMDVAQKLWDEPAIRVANGLYQTPTERVLVITGAAGIGEAALEAARRHHFLDSVALVARRGRPVQLAGPAGLVLEDEWMKQVTELYSALGGLDAALINVEVWLCDTNVELASLMLGSPQIRMALSERYQEEVGEERCRALLAQEGSSYPQLLDELLDEEVKSITGGAA